MDPEVFDLSSILYNGLIRTGPWFVNDEGHMDIHQTNLGTGALTQTKLNGMAVFDFESLQLKPGEGAIFEFDVKVVDWIDQGECVSNQAEIFFDHLEPVPTNISRICSPGRSKSSHAQGDLEVMLTPNPVNDHLKVVVPSKEAYTLEVFNEAGKLVQSIPNCVGNKIINMTTWASGVYLVKVISNEALSGTHKVVKP